MQAHLGRVCPSLEASPPEISRLFRRRGRPPGPAAPRRADDRARGRSCCIPIASSFGPATARDRAAALRRRARSADRLAARPHRSALVRRERAVRQSGPAFRHARPLHLPHALQPGREAGGPRRAPSRRRSGRERPAKDLAPVRRALSSVPRHADAPVARPRLRDAVRPDRAPERRQRRPHYDAIDAAPEDAGLPAARAVRALQHRGRSRRPSRRSTISNGTRRSATAAGRAGSSPPIGPIPSSIRTSSAFATMCAGSAS